MGLATKKPLVPGYTRQHVGRWKNTSFVMKKSLQNRLAVPLRKVGLLAIIRGGLRVAALLFPVGELARKDGPFAENAHCRPQGRLQGLGLTLHEVLGVIGVADMTAET